MKISLSNVGRVKNANIVIDGITVVAGNNGSGKSTISKGLYTALTSSYNIVGKIKQQQIRIANNLVRDWYQKLPHELRTRIRSIYIRRVFRNSHLSRNDFYEQIQKAFNGIEQKVVDEQIEILYEQYSELYSGNEEKYQSYITQVIADAIFAEQVNTANCSESATIELVAQYNHRIEFINNKVMSVDSQEQNVHPIYITTSDLIDTVGNNSKLYYARQVDVVSYDNSELVDLLMNEKSSKDFTVVEYERLIEQIAQADEIFKQVLDGDMHVEKGSLVYYDNWARKNIAIGNVASGIRIFLILQKLICNGCYLEPVFLIIDEPETNLHPEWQLKLAELLVLLYKKMGVQVYVNTHSPYFARAVEFYSNEYDELDGCRFYKMNSVGDTGMYESQDVTECLGIVYDMLAEPFNKIM